MDATQLREIATDIANNQIVNSWLTYALMAAFTLLNLAVSSGVGAYYKRRAETLASKADMDEILSQLRKTTAVAEEVKSSVAQADWVAREWNTLRRKKLEELLDMAHGLDDLMHDHSNAVTLSDGKSPSTSAIDKIQTLSTLYFPEIQLITWKTCQSYRKTVAFHFEARRKVELARGGDLTVLKNTLAQLSAEMAPLQTANVERVFELRNAAAELMKQICSVQSLKELPTAGLQEKTQQPHAA